MQYPMKVGNSKVGNDTIIMNMCSATDCPSRKLGLCQLRDANQCYAFNDEVRHRCVLPYRRKQEWYWKRMDVHNIVDNIMRKKYTRKNRDKVRYIRMSEGGDFKTQNDVDKLIEIANALHGKLVVYVYTARCDLDFSNRGKLVVNGAGFMVDNDFSVVDTFPKDGIRCIGDCINCGMCREKGNRVIYEELRRRRREEVGNT